MARSGCSLRRGDTSATGRKADICIDAIDLFRTFLLAKSNRDAKVAG
jgi:hypothetical protein